MNDQSMTPFAIAIAVDFLLMALWIHSLFENRELKKRSETTIREYEEANMRWRDQNLMIDTELGRVRRLLDKEEEGKA